MDFVIQSNMLSAEQRQVIANAVAGLPHRFVELVPFSREIVSDTPLTDLDHIPHGSTSFVEEALRRGWTGLSFDADRFSYDTAVANRDDMLNTGSILPAREATAFLRGLPTDTSVFMRPAHDLKQFAGSVYTADDAADFLKDAMACASSGSYKIDPDLLIVVSEPRNLLIEWRWFIIGGQVVDGSMYRRNGQLTKRHAPEWLCGALADNWLPDPCCVMDTALLDSGEIKVVEFNCINGSGFYDHDVRKIMTTWSRHFNG